MGQQEEEVEYRSYSNLPNMVIFKLTKPHSALIEHSTIHKNPKLKKYVTYPKYSDTFSICPIII